MASCSPVEAPEGTAARPKWPEARRTSTSTVGLPRESTISRAVMEGMVVFMFFEQKSPAGPPAGGGGGVRGEFRGQLVGVAVADRPPKRRAAIIVADHQSVAVKKLARHLV